MECATLTVNLAAVISNYNILKKRHAKNSVAAVVKAGAYGLGVVEVSRALWGVGCNDFFVATLEEAVELRLSLPQANISVFQGVFAGEEPEYINYRLTPILNDLGQLERFCKIINSVGNIPVTIHVDTGMTRLGLNESDLKNLLLSRLNTKHKKIIISHLSCADIPAHEKNSEQLLRFNVALKYFPNVTASLSNSAGVFLPQEFHFDFARTGCALYGIAPNENETIMNHVATLSAPILQLRKIERGETVGYGATYTAKKGDVIATCAIGYADGYFRSLSNEGFAYVGGYKVPVIGRVSMDMVTLDLSNLSERQINETMHVEFINEKQTVNDIARQCDTIGYEIFTRIGSRVKRVYV